MHGRIKVSLLIAVMTLYCIAKHWNSCSIHENLWECSNTCPLAQVFPFRVLEVTSLIWQILAISKGYPLLEVIIEKSMCLSWELLIAAYSYQSEFVVTEQNITAVAYFSRVDSVHNCSSPFMCAAVDLSCAF